MNGELLKTFQFIAFLLLAELALLTLPAWAGYPTALVILLFSWGWSMLDFSRAVFESSSGKRAVREVSLLEPVVSTAALVCVGLFYVYG